MKKGFLLRARRLSSFPLVYNQKLNDFYIILHVLLNDELLLLKGNVFSYVFGCRWPLVLCTCYAVKPSSSSMLGKTCCFLIQSCCLCWSETQPSDCLNYRPTVPDQMQAGSVYDEMPSSDSGSCLFRPASLSAVKIADYFR